MSREEVNMAFVAYHLDEACDNMMWAIRRLQGTPYLEEHQDEAVKLKAAYNSIVAALHDVRAHNREMYRGME